jgi:hypothetical protein
MSGGNERFWYANRKSRIEVSNMVATLAGSAGFGTATVGSMAFGSFSNGKDMAVHLGFETFTYGGYTFHMKDYKLLNDAALLGNASAGFYKGVVFPSATYTDPKTGQTSAMLSISEKSYGDGTGRGMEEWVNGAAKGIYNNDDGFDGLLFNKRSEFALVAKGMNNIALIKGATS